MSELFIGTLECLGIMTLSALVMGGIYGVYLLVKGRR